jgi:hypothetical protein
MSHFFTNAEYAAMLYVYGFCDSSANGAAEEYCQRFPTHRTPDHQSVFQGVPIRCMNIVCFSAFTFHLYKHVNNMWRNGKVFLNGYSEAQLLACKDFVHVSVFHEHVYGEHCMKTACTRITHSGCKINTQGTMLCT